MQQKESPMGGVDISGIGDGTVTGAIYNINEVIPIVVTTPLTACEIINMSYKNGKTNFIQFQITNRGSSDINLNSMTVLANTDKTNNLVGIKTANTNGSVIEFCSARTSGSNVYHNGTSALKAGCWMILMGFSDR